MLGAGAAPRGSPGAVQEARLARSEAEQATALAKAEAQRCQELAARLKEAARTQGDGGSSDGHHDTARRWVPRPTSGPTAPHKPCRVLSIPLGS